MSGKETKHLQKEHDKIWAAFGSSSDEEGEVDNAREAFSEQRKSRECQPSWDKDVGNEIEKTVGCYPGFEIIDYDKVEHGLSSTKNSSIRPSRRGIGIRAKMRFQRGDEILKEAPLLRVANCHAASNQQQAEELHAQAVQAAYDRLSSESQLSIMKLSNCGKYHNNSKKITNQLLQGIYHTNSYRLMDDDGASQSDGGMFLTIARFNHSCRPNTSHFWRSDLNRMVVFAIRSIESGEELLISYLRPSNWMITLDRRQILRRDFCFHCMCEMCNEGNRKGGDDRMRRLSRLHDQLSELVEMGRHKQVIEVVNKCLNLMERQGVASALEQTLFFRYGYGSALQLNDSTMARTFLEEELQSTINSQGIESPRAEHIRQRLQYFC